MRKQLSVLFMILCLVFAFQLTAKEKKPKKNYTTDSEITPKELDQWSVVLKSPKDVQGFYYLVAENPELHLNTLVCPIKFVLICIDGKKKEMVAYAYYRDDELMAFEIKDSHFSKIHIVPEAKYLIDWFLKPLLKKFEKSDNDFNDNYYVRGEK